MPKKKTEIQKAVGKLISSIQKEWGEQLGETSAANLTEDVMDLAHDLMQAKTEENIKKLLGDLSIRQYLGDIWVQAHPNVKPAIESIENCLSK